MRGECSEAVEGVEGWRACGMGLVRSVAGARVRGNAREAGVGRDIAKDSARRRVDCRIERFLRVC